MCCQVRVCALVLAAGEKVPSRSSSINCMTLATNHWLCQPKPSTCFFPFNGWTVNNFYYGLILLIDSSASCDLQILARTQKLVWMGEDQQYTLPSTVWKILLKQSLRWGQRYWFCLDAEVADMFPQYIKKRFFFFKCDTVSVYTKLLGTKLLFLHFYTAQQGYHQAKPVGCFWIKLMPLWSPRKSQQSFYSCGKLDLPWIHTKQKTKTALMALCILKLYQEMKLTLF